MNRRVLPFALLCCGCLVATALYAVWLVRTPHVSSTATGARDPAPAPMPQAALPVPSVSSAVKPAPMPAAYEARVAPQPSARKLLFFRANALGEHYGKLSFAPLDELSSPTYASKLSCDRAYFAKNTGICLVTDFGLFTKYSAVSFNKHLAPGWTIPLNGIPSRARVSPSGRLLSITVFLSGHSYVSLNFSTQTTIVNAATGKVLADLETFAVTRDGQPFQSPDFNFWGVTFARDENRFYATLWSKGKTYLVQCDLKLRTAAVIFENVECPSLSPDNTRIAFKKRVEGPRIAWRIHVLDLRTMNAVPTDETHSVDDQVEWLDNHHLLYARSEDEAGSSASTDIWQVASEPGGTPEILIRGAFSPAVAWVN